jgi:hypothetical protein
VLQYGALVQLVRILLCHSSGHRFESGTHRQVFLSIAQPGSAPALGAGGREFDPLYSDQFCGCRIMVIPQPSKLMLRVRFSLPAPKPAGVTPGYSDPEEVK